MKRRALWEPPSVFVQDMNLALAQRLRATTRAERRRADEHMADVMRSHLGGRKMRAAVEDRKLAAAGKDAE